MPACWRSAPSRRARATYGACTFRAAARRPTGAASPRRNANRTARRSPLTSAIPAASTGRLGAADVARYREVGYHYPVRAMSAARAAACTRRLEAHEAAHGKLLGPRRHKAHLYLTWLDEIVRLPTILDAVGGILGPDILVYGSSFFIKEPHDPGFVSWHQDAHYWGLDSGDVV